MEDTNFGRKVKIKTFNGEKDTDDLANEFIEKYVYEIKHLSTCIRAYGQINTTIIYLEK